MRKSKKKLLSMALASAMATSLLPMTAFASEASGTVDVTVGQVVPLIRVTVPTKLDVAVDQYEFTSKGSQIYSESFKMENRGESEVKINVETEATVGTGVTLVGTKDGASNANEMWLGTAAAKAAGRYVDATKDDTDLGTLNEESANVSTFDSTNKKTLQEFYLGKDSSKTKNYKLLDTGAADAANDNDLNAAKDKVKDSYVEVYELTEIEIPTGKDLETINGVLLGDDQTIGSDVYYTTSNASDENGDVALTKINKGTEYDDTNKLLPDNAVKYYKAGKTVTKKTSFTKGKQYVYIDVDNSAKAEFKYIGKLSEATTTWTNASISALKIDYTITPVSSTKYDEAEKACQYGYYQTLKPSITAKAGTGVTISDGVINLVKGSNLAIDYSLGTKELAATGIKSVTFMKGTTATALDKGTDYTIENGVITLIADGSKLKTVIGSGVTKAVLASAGYCVKVVFEDAATTTLTTEPIAVNLQ